MVVLRSTSGLHMGEFDGAEAIAALGFDRRSQQKAVFGDVNAHIRQFLGSGFLKTAVLSLGKLQCIHVLHLQYRIV